MCWFWRGLEANFRRVQRKSGCSQRSAIFEQRFDGFHQVSPLYRYYTFKIRPLLLFLIFNFLFFWKEIDLSSLCRNLIRPGGFIVYHTFMEGCLKPRTKKFLLAPGELKAIFEQENQFEILEDKVIHLDDGRPTSYFLARKKATDTK